MDKEKIINARKIIKMRCITGLVLCVIVIALTTISILLNSSNFYHEDSAESGLGTFRMFTTISNIVAAVAAFTCIPFQIDGLRRDKYKLPDWIVSVMYVGVVGTFLTFFVAITLISANRGFDYAMLQRSNLMMHTINPIFITLLFTVIISDSRVKFHQSFYTMIPITVYAIVYFIMVFVVKEWRDHYQTDTFVPWPVTLLIVIIVSFGISQLLRFLHNLTNKYVTNSIKRYYLESSDYDFPKVSGAVANLAKVESKFYHEGDDIYIPVDIIDLLSQRYGANSIPVDILYDIYLENYLICTNKKQN